MRRAALALTAAALALPAAAQAGSCSKIVDEFATADRIRTSGGAGCAYAHYFARKWIRKSERGDLGPVTLNGYRCRGTTIASQTLRVTCEKGDRRVVFRLLIRNG